VENYKKNHNPPKDAPKENTVINFLW